MSALTAVRDVLQPLGFPLLGRVPGNVTGITLVTTIGQVERSATLPAQFRDWTVDVLVLSPLVDPAAADVELEDALDDVLDAIDAAQPLRWATSERQVISENFNAVHVPVTVTMQPPPPPLQEQP